MKECQLCRYFIILVISRTFVYLIFQGRIYKVAIVKLWILFFFTAFASYVWNVIKSCKYIFYLKRSRWTSLYALTIISTLETLFLSHQKSPHRCILQRSSWPILLLSAKDVDTGYVVFSLYQFEYRWTLLGTQASSSWSVQSVIRNFLLNLIRQYGFFKPSVMQYSCKCF